MERIYVTGIPGQTFVQDPRLAYVDLQLCVREGRMLIPTTGTPTGKHYQYVTNEGKVILPDDQPIQSILRMPGPLEKFPPIEVPEEFYFEYKTS